MAVREPQEGLRRHKLITKDVRAALPPLRAQDGKGEDAVAYLKLFSPYGRYTFYVTEFDGEDALFGYILSPLGPDCDEWGYSSLREISEVMMFGGKVPGIERDRFFEPTPVREVIRRGR